MLDSAGGDCASDVSLLESNAGAGWPTISEERGIHTCLLWAAMVRNRALGRRPFTIESDGRV